MAEATDTLEETQGEEQLALFEGKPVIAFRGAVGNLGDFPMTDELHGGDEVQITVVGKVVKVGAHFKKDGVTRSHTISADLDTLKVELLAEQGELGTGEENGDD